jgi:hypothetical protein
MGYVDGMGLKEAFGGNPENWGDPWGNFLVVITTTSNRAPIPPDQGIRHSFGLLQRPYASIPTQEQREAFKDAVRNAILEGKRIANERGEFFDLAFEGHASHRDVRDAFREVLDEIYRSNIYFKIRSLTLFYCFSRDKEVEENWYERYLEMFDIDFLITVKSFSIGSVEDMQSTTSQISIHNRGCEDIVSNLNLLDWLNTLGRELPPLPKEE